MTDLDAIRYMTNTTDSLEAQACHMLADAVSALQARVAALEAASKSDESPETVTLDKAAFDEAIAELREAWEEVFGKAGETDGRIDRALRLLTGN